MMSLLIIFTILLKYFYVNVLCVITVASSNKGCGFGGGGGGGVGGGGGIKHILIYIFVYKVHFKAVLSQNMDNNFVCKAKDGSPTSHKQITNYINSGFICLLLVV